MARAPKKPPAKAPPSAKPEEVLSPLKAEPAADQKGLKKAKPLRAKAKAGKTGAMPDPAIKKPAPAGRFDPMAIRKPLPKLDEKKINIVRAMFQSGAETKEVAAFLKVDVLTVEELVEKHPDLRPRPLADAAEAAAGVTYQERFCALAHLMTRAGQTEEEVAEALGIDLETLILWRLDHWKFDRAFDANLSGSNGGRPSPYQEKFAEQGKLLAKLGATDLEISQFFGVALRTIHRWKIEHPEFREALEMGKDEADKKVEDSLYRRAVGYTFDSEKIVVVDKELQRVETIEHVPPDTKAAMFWLQNRRPGIWRDTKHIKHDVEEESALGSWLKDISGNSFQPKDQDGPASSDAPRSTAFAPSDDGQGTSDAV